MINDLPLKLRSSVSRFDSNERELIRAAYIFARTKHQGQRRRSGGPYIQHPLRVAVNLAIDHYDSACIIASLLHDTLEDTATTPEEIEQKFGPDVAMIVRGVTAVSAYKLKEKDKVFSDMEMYLSRVENYRKILLAAAADPRVIIVKLYDRLDNASTISSLPAQKQKFYARETIEIFAPLAERLGMGMLKGKLEDVSFPYAYPEEYQEFSKNTRPIYRNPASTVDKVKPKVEQLLDDAGINVISISGRAKHLFSLYKKIERKGSLKAIFDIIALRVIVDSIESCYKTLGLIHTHFPPHPNRIHDYIARPKLNGYQSIHTTVADPEGNLFEVQIRTLEMHRHAEYGLAAHWEYKDEKPKTKQSKQSTIKWLKEVEKIRMIEDKSELLGQLKGEFFSDQVFVFTPKGDIIDLPTGSTGLDFAYRIHSALGNRCSGIKINGRIVPIPTPLRTGDAVEVITSPKAKPSRDWLKIVKTTQAKHHIRNFLRESQSAALLARGLSILNKGLNYFRYPSLKKEELTRKIDNQKIRLPYKTLDKAIIALAENNISKVKLLKLLHPEIDNSEKRKRGSYQKTEDIPELLKGIRHTYANCCKAKDSRGQLVGYLTKDHIIKIHDRKCKRLANVDERRLFELF